MGVLVAVAGLLGAVFASLSNGVAVLTRQRETLIGIVTMVTLPLTFGLIATRTGFLALLLLARAAVATRAFNAYQRSI